MSGKIESFQSAPDFIKLKSELFNHPDGPALFEDQHFVPKYNILFNKKSQSEFGPSDVNWYRPGQLCKSPVLLSNDSSDFLKGALSPEWFPTLLTILREKNLIELVMPSMYFQNTFNQDPMVITPTRMTYCGAFLFTFRRGGVLENVVIDDRIPCTLNCHPLGIASSKDNDFIGALIEKAYAKYVGGYYNLHKQDFLTALMDFTGGLVETISMKGDDKLTKTEIESLYNKMNNIVGNSFIFCRGYQGQFAEKGQRVDSFMSDTHLLNATSQIPTYPPHGVFKDIADSINQRNGEKNLVPVVKIKSIGNEIFSNGCVSGSKLDESWNQCPNYILKWYRLSYSEDNTEQWIPIEELPCFCEQVIFLHLLTRNPIVAVARKQKFWKFSQFDHFWHRDGPRGSVEENEPDDFLQNSQYLFNVYKEEGCQIKIVLTNTQKYVDTGANMITPSSKYCTGITILEVERNRQYLVHDLSQTSMINYRVDCQIDRTLIVSSQLSKGTYVIIPWLSDGYGTKYTIQIFSSTISSDAMKLDLHVPEDQYCLPCQFKRTAQNTSSKINSIYRRPSTPTKQNGVIGNRKVSTQPPELCSECRAQYPKMATRITVESVDNIQLTRTSQLPNFYFRLTCDRETIYSRTINQLAPNPSHTNLPAFPTSTYDYSPKWNEKFIFYRAKFDNDTIKIEVFCDGKFGMKHNIGEYTFNEKELRQNGKVTVNLRTMLGREYIPLDSTLNVFCFTYFPSDFNKV